MCAKQKFGIIIVDLLRLVSKTKLEKHPARRNSFVELDNAVVPHSERNALDTFDTGEFPTYYPSSCFLKCYFFSVQVKKLAVRKRRHIESSFLASLQASLFFSFLDL